jgi:hypothetical protein
MGSSSSVVSDKYQESENQFVKCLSSLENIDDLYHEQVYQQKLNLLEMFQFDEMQEEIPLFTTSPTIERSTKDEKTMISNEETKEKRKVVIFIDGTLNTYHSKHRSNIALLYDLIKKNVEQKKINDHLVLKYFSGIGTQKSKSVTTIDSAAALSLNKMILKIYYFICHHYHDGDELIFFGFSRGSYLARIIVALLRWKGIPKHLPVHETTSNNDNSAKKEEEGIIALPDAAGDRGMDGAEGGVEEEQDTLNLDLVSTISNKFNSICEKVVSEEEEEEFYEKILFDFMEISRENIFKTPENIARQTNTDDYIIPTITFLGLYDTVASVPTSFFERYDCFFHFEDVKSVSHILSSNVSVLFQNLSYFSCNKEDNGLCISIEEKPSDFNNLKYQKGQFQEYRIIGDHCNIGGGWLENPKQEKAISNTTLRQMLKSSPFYELESTFSSDEYPTVGVDEDPQPYIRSVLNENDMKDSAFCYKVYNISEGLFGKNLRPNLVKKIKFPIYSFPSI